MEIPIENRGVNLARDFQEMFTQNKVCVMRTINTISVRVLQQLWLCVARMLFRHGSQLFLERG